MKTKKLSKSDLVEFTGTEQWYRHQIVKNILYTDGLKFIAETAGAYWFIDAIAFQQLNSKVKGEEFQVWTLQVNLQECSAILTCEDGNDRIVFSEQIGYTDFPLEEIKVYVTNRVILLPSEY